MTAHGADVAQLMFTDPTPLRDDQRARILRAIRATDAMHGQVDPGRVRRLLTDHNGDLRCDPRALSGAYSHLARAGVIATCGWTTNDDRRGGNAGRPQRLWKVTDRAALDLMIGDAR